MKETILTSTLPTHSLPTHSLPKAAGEAPVLKIFRFKNSPPESKTTAPGLLPVTPLPTNAPHRHSYYEILFFEEGQGFHEVDFRTYPVSAPSVHFLPPGKVHLLTPTSDCRGYIMAFSEGFYSFYGTPQSVPLSQVPFFQSGVHEPVLSLNEETKRYLQYLLENMVGDLLEGSAENSAILGSYLHIFLQKCQRLTTRPPDLSAPSATHPSDLTGRFREMVEKNFREMHEVQQYATALDVTPDYLSKIVKKSVGVSAGEYILDKLLLEAKRLLVFTQMSSKEISYHIHIEDPSYFGRIFKRKTGLTPNEYRISVRKSASQ
ncbi:AraC family transcriptional regulator [Telluribacter sp.]|jgi:AraC-like DNA-binding protein/quercetin dioxygenase-like cupin family protein|uniref:helix-turn-helix domain-containing protein n=1 Tax=Telluribacter sp. TaxID=1978767 RepID=UPI002E0ED619|nr:AraC family transcriptional regulator [Telluribacter sp.]